MLELLQSIVNKTGKRGLGRVITSKPHIDLYNWIIYQTSNLPENVTIIERIHVILNPSLSPFCENGNKRRFVPNPPEYKFCGTLDKCQCYRDNHSLVHPPLSTETRLMIYEKRKITWMKKYGTDNPSKNNNVTQKRKTTMKSKSYTELHNRLKNSHQLTGFNTVVERVKEYVTPLFTFDEYKGCFRKNFYKWACTTCDEVVIDHVDYGRIPRCLSCYPNGESRIEKYLQDYIKSLGVEIKTNDKSILGNLEYDIWIPEKNIAIEYNGVYWHSTEWKEPDYHVNKFLRSRDAGVKLIQIFEDEWLRKSDIIKSRLKSILGIGDRIYARKCTISEISGKEYNTFTELYHLQGNASATYKYGLYYDTKLVAIMSFSRSRYTNDGYELIRYCSKGNVIGGASKLFNYFIKNIKPIKIISYANRCWSDGGLYKTLGFVNTTVDDANIGYWYIKGQDRYHRSSFTKAKLVDQGYDPTLTESEIMKSAGYLKLYDCGNYRFEWNCP